jgi:outer membrane protein assembly factor BamB
VAGDAIVIAGGGRVAAFDVKSGSARWHVDGQPFVATGTPVADGGKLFVNLTGLAGDIDRVEPVPFDQALKRWDKNGDGKLQRAEIPDELAVFTRRRADHEGDFGLNQWFFQRGDADRDGALSREEWDNIWGKAADVMIANMKPTLAAVRLGGTDNVSQSHVAWKVHRGVPEVPSLLVHAGRVYAVRNGGVVSCFDAETGRTLFEERLGPSGSYYASPVTDGTHVYFVSQPGVVTVIQAGDRFERLATNDLGEPVAATPAVVGGTLYVRTEQNMYAFGTRP